MIIIGSKYYCYNLLLTEIMKYVISKLFVIYVVLSPFLNDLWCEWRSVKVGRSNGMHYHQTIKPVDCLTTNYGQHLIKLRITILIKVIPWHKF